MFHEVPVSYDDFIREPNWYLERPGFWHGACGPAACWAGGAAGLVDYAIGQSRCDSHTMVHLGAMHAAISAVRSFLDSAGDQIDLYPDDRENATYERLPSDTWWTDVLRRLPRAYGPIHSRWERIFLLVIKS